MHQYQVIFLLTILCFTFSCKKPCAEEPVGAEPLSSYHVEWSISSDNLLDAINVLWDSDSVFFFDENYTEIPFEWNGGPGTGNNHSSEPFYFYNYPQDEVAYEELVSKLYYFEFHNFFGIDKDTLEINFRAVNVECGQVLEPLEFYFNGMQVDSRGGANKRIIILNK